MGPVEEPLYTAGKAGSNPSCTAQACPKGRLPNGPVSSLTCKSCKLLHCYLKLHKSHFSFSYLEWSPLTL
jgi:hypothetical protein